MSFTFLRVQVLIHPLFWVFLLFFSNLCFHPCLENLLLGAIFLISLLVHEYGHALTALCFGARPTITLEGFGGSVCYPERLSSKQRFLITLNGPLFESLLIVVPYTLLNLQVFAGHPWIQYALMMTMKINMLWCLLNLIPIAPLDGGYLLEYLLEKRWGMLGLYRSKQIGIVLAAAASCYLFKEGSFFFATLLLLFGWNQWQEIKHCQSPSHRKNPFFFYIKGVEALQERKLSKAKTLLKRLLDTQSPSMKTSAIESLAKIYLEENKPQKAYNLLQKADPALLKEGKCLLCKLAFERGDYEVIATYAREIYLIEPTEEIALLNARAFAKLGQEKPSQAWAATAAQFQKQVLS